MSGKTKKLSKKCSNLLNLRDPYLISGECNTDQLFFWKTLQCTWSIFKVSSKFLFKSWKNVHFVCTHVILLNVHRKVWYKCAYRCMFAFWLNLNKITCVQAKCTQMYIFSTLKKKIDETLKIDQLHSKVFQKSFWSLLHSPLIRYGSLKFSKFEHFLDNFLFLPDIAYFYFAL